MYYHLLEAFENLPAGQIVRWVEDRVAGDGALLRVVERRGSRYEIAAGRLLAAPWPPAPAPLIPAYKPSRRLLPGSPASAVSPRRPARGKVTPIDRPGRRLRLFFLPRLAPADVARLSCASEDLTLATGDQSLAEALSALKAFVYESVPGKDAMAVTLDRLDRGLEARPMPATTSADVIDREFDYLDVLALGERLDRAEDQAAKLQLLNLAYPAALARDLLVFVTTRDAGWEGDAVAALRTADALRERYGCAQVHLALPPGPRRRALELGVSASQVWRVGAEGRGQAGHITQWPVARRAREVLIVQVAGIPEPAMEAEIRSHCVLGDAASALSIHLAEYGLARQNPPLPTLGLAPGEFGIHVDHARLATALERGYGADTRAARAGLIATLDAETLAGALLEGREPDRYADTHRLYFGFSRAAADRFVKLVAHREGALAHKAETVDVILVGSTGDTLDPPRLDIDGLLGELESGGGPDLDRLGFASADVYRPERSSRADPVEPEPHILGGLSRTGYAIGHAKPSDDATQPPNCSVAEFLQAMNPGASIAPAGVSGRAAYERFGAWLAGKESRERFRRLGWFVATHRDCVPLLGGLVRRQRRAARPAPRDGSRDELQALERAFFESEGIARDELMRLRERAHRVRG